MMSNAGLSTARLARMHDVMTGYVERGAVPGLVTLIYRRDAVHLDTIGRQAIDGREPVRRDTIFRISSMTKPITAVATMILIEECRLRLDEPVEHLLPELAARRVLQRLDGPLDETVPADRPITVRDLLTFRLGFGQMMAPPDAYPILRAANERQIGLGPPSPATTPAPDEWLRRLGTLPLMYQPGERWMYNTGSDVLGVLIARAAGQPFEVFLAERIFAPLGMVDTGFFVPAEKLHRFATSYRADPATGALVVFDEAIGGQWNRAPAFPSGAGGLVSTVDDYLTFCQMLLNKGKYGRERILSRPAVELMTMDHLTPAQKAETDLFLGDDHGWGFGVSPVTRRNDLYATPGSYGWAGGLGTAWSSDPAEELIGLLLTQFAMGAPTATALLQDFWTSVYQAIDD